MSLYSSSTCSKIFALCLLPSYEVDVDCAIASRKALNDSLDDQCTM
jgi:hypothetical protein